MRLGGGIAAAGVAFALAACAQTTSVTESTEHTSQAIELSDLPGWEQEDHVTALGAVRAACVVSRDPEMPFACANLPTDPDERRARAWLERNFYAVPLGGEGRLTGYFMPVYEARRTRSEVFSAPVRPRPSDLPTADDTVAGRATYADRAEIEARPAPNALAWMRPEDLFFMQVQGAGVLEFPDGDRAKAVFDGSNGAAFVGIAQPMRSQGLISDADSSADAIHDWLAAHRGEAARAIMDLDPRYGFYRLTADDGQDPAGSAGVRLPPGRAAAVDPAYHASGELLWIDGDSPSLAGAFPAYRRLVAALDAGGAIKGPVRADLYVGRGEAAGREAGRIRHVLTLYRLAPR
ncbi:MAG TPA: MltA domain-containing protein [Caulobacteraceae bacterium]